MRNQATRRASFSRQASSKLLAFFFALVLLIVLVHIPAWTMLVQNHDPSKPAGLMAEDDHSATAIASDSPIAAVAVGSNPFSRTFLGQHDHGSPLALHLNPAGLVMKPAEESEHTHVDHPHSVPPKKTEDPADAAEQSEADRVAAEEFDGDHLNDDNFDVETVFATKLPTDLPSDSLIAAAVHVCGTCTSWLPMNVLGSMEEIATPALDSWTELIIAMPLRKSKGSRKGPLSGALGMSPPLLAETGGSVEEQLQALSKKHRVRIVIARILQGREVSHRHDLDQLVWDNLLPPLAPLLSPSVKDVLFIGPRVSLVKSVDATSTTMEMGLHKQRLAAIPDVIVGVAILTGETDESVPTIVSAGITVMPGSGDEPLLADRLAGHSSADARLFAGRIRDDASLALPSPYAFLCSRRLLAAHYPGFAERSAAKKPLPLIERKFFVATTPRDLHLNPEIHSTFAAFGTAALVAGARTVFVSPIGPDGAGGAPFPSAVVDLPGWTPTLGGSLASGLKLRDVVPTPPSTELKAALAKLLPSAVEAPKPAEGDSKSHVEAGGFLRGVTLKWDTFCIPCFGFSNEVMHFIAPLEGLVELRSKVEPGCFCPGTPRAFAGGLARLASMKEFEGRQRSDAQLRRKQAKEHGGEHPAHVGADPGHDHQLPGEATPDERIGDVSVFVAHKDPGSFPHGAFDLGLRPDVIVGRAMYEFTKLPGHWVKHQKDVDEIWVPSRFARTVFIDNGFDKDKLFVVPEPIDVFYYDPRTVRPIELPVRDNARRWKHATNIVVLEDEDDDDLNVAEDSPSNGLPPEWYPRTDKAVGGLREVPRSALRRSSHFNFLSVFKWEERKAWDVLLRSYFTAFKASDPVSLYLIAYTYGDSSRSAQAMMARVKSLIREMRGESDEGAEGGEGQTKGKGDRKEGPAWPDVPHVEIISEQLTEDEMLAMYRSVDAFVLPTRGEGWGLPLIQAMAMGLPTIATNWSGNVDFMTEDTSYLLRVDSLSAVPEGSMYGADDGKYWADPSESHLVELLKHVSTNRLEAAKVGRKARDHIVRHYSDEVIAEVVKSRLRTLRDGFWEKREAAAGHDRAVHDLFHDDNHLIV